MDSAFYLGVFAFVQIFFCVTAKNPDYEQVAHTCLKENGNSFPICLTNFLDQINREHVAEGVPELNIPPFDPFKLDNLNFNRNDGTIALNAIFSNVLASGFSKRVVQKVRYNKRQKSLNIRVMIPKFHIKGTYDLKGRVLVVNITGNGDFTVDIDKVFATLKSQVGERNVGDRTVPTVTNTVIELGFGKLITQLNNLFEGDETMGRAVNHFINENSDLILKEVEGEITKRIAEMVEPMLVSGVSYFPNEVLL